MQLIDSRYQPDSQQQKELVEKQRRFQLARLITLSEEMLEAARVADWEKVEQLELLRRVELDECFAMQHDNPSLLIAQALATLVHINEQIVYLVKQARDHAGAENRRMRGVHTAMSAYSQGLEPG